MSDDDAPIRMLLGDEALLVSEAEEATVRAALGGPGSAFNLATYQAGEGAAGALSLARTPPMMSKRRVVVIRELERAGVALLDDLLAYAENPSPTTLLVLVGSKTPPAAGGRDRGKVLANLVQKRGGLSRFRSRDQRPEAFATERARAAGCDLDRDAARLLVELVGADLGQLRMELDKAIAFVGGGGRIDRAVVEATASVVAEAVQWDLTDAIVARDPDRGLAATYRMLEDAGASSGGAHRLLALVSWQMRELLTLQESVLRGTPVPAKWARMNHRKLDAARRNLKARPLRPDVVLGALTRANRRLNASRAGGQRIFEALVMELTTG